MSAGADKSSSLGRLMPIVMLLALVSCLPLPAAAEETTYLLFRHAEKSDQGDDPVLSEQGRQRALALAASLQQAGVTRIFSSDYNRTRETVAPASQLMGIEIELYDPADLEGFANALRGMSGVIAICGHSNTTPELASLLSGEATEPMPESEYGRVYTVVVKDSGGTTVRATQGG